MASPALAVVQHVVTIVLCVGLANMQVLASPSCPAKCMCLGNIADCSASQISFLPEDIRDCPWIEQLKLNQNPGLNLSSSDLPLLPHLAVLELKKLGLLEFPDLGELPELTNLSLRDNELSIVGPLDGVPRLRHLDLSRNSLTALPAHLHLPHLAKLNLDRNRLVSVSGTGAGLGGLQELRLVKNAMTEEPLLSSGLLNNLPSLTTLNLHYNHLRQLPGLMFQNCSALRYLKLSKNKITTLNDGVFYGLKDLRTLSLDQNNLTVVSNKWLFGLDALEDLSLRHNAITSLAADAFHSTTPSLISLDLSYNSLVSLHASLLKGLQNLEYLQISHNRLSTIRPETFKSTPNLLQLDLSYNDLRWSIEDGGDAYVGLSNLQRIDLSQNNIESVQYEALAPMTSLIKLDLRYNAIRTLHDSPFRNIQARAGETDQILLNTSNIVCDCHLSWLQSWLNHTSLDLSQMHATCSYPPDKVGVDMTLLSNDPLPCTFSPRPIIQNSPEDRIILLDADVELKCEALVGSRGGDPLVLWRRNNQHIEPYKHDKKMSVERPDPSGGVISLLRSVLHLSSVSHTDAGRYQCIVRNNFGAAYSQQALIEVQVKPYFTVLPASVHTQVGSVARLECAADGLPPPEISLQKGGSDDFPAAGERRLLVDSEKTVFFIKPVTVEDEGLYTCTAKSTAGVTTASANITVSQAPLFLQPVHDATVRPGDTAVMHCQGSGRPAPSISWVRNGEVIASSSSSRHKSVEGGAFLIVLNVQLEDDGPYTCQLTNTYGTRRQTMHLTVFDGLLMDGKTTLGMVMMAVVVFVIITSAVWVLIIYCSKQRRPKRENSILGRYPRSPPSSPHHDYILSTNHTPVPTDPMLGEDPARCTDIVVPGPDTGSEHSTGKDSGVGDSSQRSSEDLRLLQNSGTATLASSGAADLDRQTPVHSALMVYAEHNLPAVIRGGSTLSVATDSDVRYDDCRPRLSTFGAGGSATLRRPSGHRPIPVLGPYLARHNTSTLPHNHSFKTRNKMKKAAETSTLPAKSKIDLENVKNNQVEDSDISSNSPVRSTISSNSHASNPSYNQFTNHYKDGNPYSRPNNRAVVSDRHPNMLQNRNLSPLASPQYMSAKCITSDDASESEANPRYVSSNNSTKADGQPVYMILDRHEAPQYMSALSSASHNPTDANSVNCENPIYKHQRELGLPGRLSQARTGNYSTPSIIYNADSDDVQMSGIGPAVPPPPPLPPSKPNGVATPIYGCSNTISSPLLMEPSAPR